MALRFALMGAVAFVSACVAHEAVGHGGTCLLTGGRVQLLSSVYFRCAPGRALVDAGGPSMNLVVAAMAMWLMRRLRSPGARTFAALAAAFNAMLGAGYLVFSAVTDHGDWAYVLRAFPAVPNGVARLLIGLLGAWLYRGALRATRPCLPRGAPLAWAWVGGGLVESASVLLFAGPALPALREAVQESLLASVGLLYLAFAGSSSAQAAPVPVEGARAGWWWVGLGVLLVFLVTLGPGFRAA